MVKEYHTLSVSLVLNLHNLQTFWFFRQINVLSTRNFIKKKKLSPRNYIYFLNKITVSNHFISLESKKVDWKLCI